jgi:hypothetical protein
VPADPLALGRSRQVVKEGWATRLRGLKSFGKSRNRQSEVSNQITTDRLSMPDFCYTF